MPMRDKMVCNSGVVQTTCMLRNFMCNHIAVSSHTAGELEAGTGRQNDRERNSVSYRKRMQRDAGGTRIATTNFGGGMGGEACFSEHNLHGACNLKTTRVNKQTRDLGKH